MITSEEEQRTSFRVLLDDLTVERLMELACECEADPRTLIAAIIKGVLAKKAGEWSFDQITMQ